MSQLEFLSRLTEGVRRSSYDYRPSLDPFPELDGERISTDLRLSGRGKERGEKGEPPSNSSEMDEVELQIIDKIEGEKKASYGSLLDQIKTFDDRIANLDLESRFDVIEAAAEDAITQFSIEAVQGRDELFTKRRNLQEHEKHYDEFRKANRLSRPAHSESNARKFWSLAVLAAVFAIEAGANGMLLSKGSDLGRLGGIVEASFFAFLNVGMSFLIAYHGIRRISRKDHPFQSIVGVVLLVVLIVLAVLFNWVFAHYRDVVVTSAATGTVEIESAGRAVLERLAASPFKLEDIMSLLLFFFGLGFAIIAAADAFFYDDPCPGYGPLHRRVAAAHDDYKMTKEDLIENLQSIRDQAGNAMDDAKRDLNVRRDEYSAILNHRGILLERYRENLNHLERTANTLLAKYRDANREARDGDSPRRFREKYAIERPTVPERQGGEFKQSNLDKRIETASKTLKKNIGEINAKLEKAVEGYHEIEEILRPDELEKHG